MLAGGYPDARSRTPTQRARYLRSYVQSVLCREEIVKQATWSRTPVETFYYRDAEGREVDLVLESASGEVVGIEAKSATAVRTHDTRGLRLLRERLGRRFKLGIVVYSGAHTLPAGDRIWAVPVSGLWAAG